MTSKNLCFKLMVEDLKRRVWTIALTILGLVFTLLVPMALKCSEFIEEKGRWEESTRRRMVNNIVSLLGVNGFLVFILLICCVLWAVSGFHYLHNSKKVDFYHSIPVKRHVLFVAAYLNGLLVPAVIYLVVLVPAVALALRTGIGVQVIGTLPWRMFVLNMVYYSMLYTTTVIAMMMTGNVVVALLGTGVFCGYGPMVSGLTGLYYECWFHTFYGTAADVKRLYRAVRYSSPFANYMYALTEFADNSLNVGTLLGAVAVTAALAVLAYGLYRNRASEAAGKAMAFSRSMMPIKILLVLPLSLASGMFFYGLRNTVVWLIFGTVCGTLLTHCLMEIIYHFDFRKLFANRAHLGVCMAVSVLLSLAGRYDWFGYDSWLPDPAKVESGAVVWGYEDDWVTYGHPVREDRYDWEQEYYWEYGGMEEYVLGQMKLTDTYSVMELAREGVEAEKNRRSRSNKPEDPDSRWNRVLIQFTMTNGKTAVRSYSVPVNETTEELHSVIHDSQEYKLGTYPILSQTASDTVGVYFQQYNQKKKADLDQESIAELLTVYQKDFEELTMETRRKELPVATLQFRTKEMQEAIEFNVRHLNNISDRCYYPVYPSFARTLKALEQAGIRPVALDEKNISCIEIYYWDSHRYEEQTASNEGAALLEDETVRYEKAEDIRTLAPALCYQDYVNMNSCYAIGETANVDVSVTIQLPEKNGEQETEKNRNYLSCYLDTDRLTEEAIEKYGLIRVK